MDAKNLFDAVGTSAKLLFAGGLPQDEFPTYVESYRKNLKDLSLKISREW